MLELGLRPRRMLEHQTHPLALSPQGLSPRERALIVWLLLNLQGPVASGGADGRNTGKACFTIAGFAVSEAAGPRIKAEINTF